MKTPSRSAVVPVAVEPQQLHESLREPLAVLVLGTQILSRYGGRMEAEVREEQRAQMQAAAAQLQASLGGESKR